SAVERRATCRRRLRAWNTSESTERLFRAGKILKPGAFIVMKILLGDLDQALAGLPGDGELGLIQVGGEGAGNVDGFVMFEGVGGGDADVFGFVFLHRKETLVIAGASREGWLEVDQ